MKKILLSFAIIPLIAPLTVFAAIGYVNPLVTIPGYNPGDGLQSFVNLLYGIAISIAALLAVIKIVIAGVKWMLSDVVTSKAEAKKDIQSALFGLIIIISAVLIITIINPSIVN